MSIAALAPISPKHLKRILELHGYTETASDEYNWVLDLDPPGVPIILGRKGDLVPLEILMDVVFTKAQVGLARYLHLRQKADTGGFLN